MVVSSMVATMVVMKEVLSDTKLAVWKAEMTGSTKVDEEAAQLVVD